MDLSSLWSFARAFRGHWFAAMSGSFSVPFTAAAVYLDNKYAQGIFALLALAALWFAAYCVWLNEWKKNCDVKELVSGLFDRESSIQRLVELQAEGRRLYNQTDRAPDDYNRDLEDWESRVADFIVQHYSVSELHAFRSNMFSHGGEYTVSGVSPEWREATQNRRVISTARITALDRTVHTGGLGFFEPRLKLAEWMEKHR